MFNQLLRFFHLSLRFGFIAFAEFITHREFGIPFLSLPETSHLKQTSPCAKESQSQTPPLTPIHTSRGGWAWGFPQAQLEENDCAPDLGPCRREGWVEL